MGKVLLKTTTLPLYQSCLLIKKSHLLSCTLTHIKQRYKDSSDYASELTNKSSGTGRIKLTLTYYNRGSE